MAFLDSLASNLNKHFAGTGEPPDLARGRKASRKVGAMMVLHGVAMLVGLAGIVTCIVGGIGFAAAVLMTGAAATGLGFGAMKLSLYGANRVLKRDGAHMNAYHDELYPEKAAKRVQDMKALTPDFNSEADVTTDSPVTTMKPLKFQPRKTAQQAAGQA